MIRTSRLAAIALSLLIPVLSAESAEFITRVQSVPWQQADREASFVAFVEREELSPLDKESRMVFAVQTGAGGKAAKLSELSVRWQLTGEKRVLAEQTTPIDQGIIDVGFSLAGLPFGRYDVNAELMRDGKPAGNSATFFRYVDKPAPAQSGRIPLILPRGVPKGDGGWPIVTGVPFPKGALWSKDSVRVVTAGGKPVPAQTIVRSRWGYTGESSIRWLGLDFQAGEAPAYWPERKDVGYYVEYGPNVRGVTSGPKVTTRETPEGIAVDTGALSFLVRRKGFNLIDDVRLNGRPVADADERQGLYLIDHEGAVYRAANDGAVSLAVEEAGGLRAVIRAEGWYVKDGSPGETVSYTLPTDKLCKFIVRVEAYAGKPYVRILNTWVLTFDPNTVRLRDVGMDLPAKSCSAATFGVENAQPVTIPVSDKGAYLIQHLPGRFDIEDGGGKALGRGERSAGWMTARTAGGLLTVGHRETWQRFPKEFEALPDSVRLHIWPAHGKDHPEIKETLHEEISRLWFCHQGRELDLAQPWKYYFAVAQIWDKPNQGVYDGPGLALAGVHASSLGAALTSDIMIHFASAGAAEEPQRTAERFQAAPHAIADPKWTCDSLAMGWFHPYDPENMKMAEETIEDMMRGYWETGNTCGEFGMWLYRPWHHTSLQEPGRWTLYRLYNATHHYDAFMPWMLYARSGDPFYLTQGSANMRLLTDVQTIHYDDPKYPHVEFHFGQGRLVGSTKHTNGFNTWGGDHGILAHLTCYNAMMLAHFMTGDLRLREVVVDEWQKTLLTDRLNPEYAKADRSKNRGRNGARDVTCALGEMIDLYQMTYDPRILALMAPAMDFFLNQFMRPWGQPIQNVLLYYGSEQARRQVIEGVEEHRASGGKPEDPKAFWYTHSPENNFALASLIKPDTNAHIDAWLAANVTYHRAKALDIRNQKPRAMVFCALADYVVYLPRVMAAVAAAGGDTSIKQIVSSQPFPSSDHRIGGWTRIVVKEDKDQDIRVEVTGKVEDAGAPVKIYGPDNEIVLEQTVPAGVHSPYTVTVPRDGKTGQYVIFMKATDNKSKLFVPLTNLPEVYHMSYWAQHAHTRFFIRPTGDQPGTISVQPHRTPAYIIANDGREVLASTQTGEVISAEVGPDGAWIMMNSRYVHLPKPIVMSISPDRWFAPDKNKLELKP